MPFIIHTIAARTSPFHDLLVTKPTDSGNTFRGKSPSIGQKPDNPLPENIPCTRQSVRSAVTVVRDVPWDLQSSEVVSLEVGEVSVAPLTNFDSRPREPIERRLHAQRGLAALGRNQKG
jgi:hypothetical protein